MKIAVKTKDGLIVSFFEDTGISSYDDELSQLLSSNIILGGYTLAKDSALKADVVISKFFEKVLKTEYNGDKPKLEYLPNVIN